MKNIIMFINNLNALKGMNIHSEMSALPLNGM